MLLLTLQLPWPEIIVLQIGALILGCTIYFFLKSRRSLQQTMQGTPVLQQCSARKSLPDAFAPGEVMGTLHPRVRPAAVTWPDPLEIAPGTNRKEAGKSPAAAVAGYPEAPASGAYATISTLMQRVEQLEALAGTRQIGLDLQQRVEELERALAEKAAALKQARQQETIAQQMSSRMEEVFRDFEQLQQKMAALETQAAAAQEQAIELDDLQRAYHLLQKDLMRKQDKLDDLLEENQRLQLELAGVTEKLQLADQQRQQLSQRSRAMQDVQIDLEAISEGQSKLQQQLRRIGELEMMLEQFGGKMK